MLSGSLLCFSVVVFGAESWVQGAASRAELCLLQPLLQPRFLTGAFAWVEVVGRQGGHLEVLGEVLGWH